MTLTLILKLDLDMVKMYHQVHQVVSIAFHVINKTNFQASKCVVGYSY